MYPNDPLCILEEKSRPLEKAVWDVLYLYGHYRDLEAQDGRMIVEDDCIILQIFQMDD